ncbi:MAG: upper collar protein [Podoviridae sp. ctbd591]|nr:MAG: upper collar protein [Podoviridae sp. ctbd591]
MSLFMGFPLPNFNCSIALPNEAQSLNDIMTIEIFNRITNIALSRFKWINLPETCNERALEMTLYFYGKALFFYDENFGLMHTPFTDSSEYNIYYEPTIRHAFSFNYSEDYSISNSVIIRENITQSPPYYSVLNFSPRIADSIRSIDVHTQTLKRPFIAYCNEKERTSMKRILESIKDNEFAIVGRKFTQENSIGVLSLVDKSYLLEMWANVDNYLHQAFSSIGIRNNYSDKKERIITSEAEGEDVVIRHVLESALSSRKRACEKINKMFSKYLKSPIDVESNEIEAFTDEIILRERADVEDVEDSNVSEYT